MYDGSQGCERPASWLAVLAGVALFLVSGLGLILGEIPHGWPVPPWLPGLRHALLLGSLVFPAVVLGIGWVKDFPRWSYPYVGFVLLTSLYMMNVATPGLRVLGYTFGRNDLWGCRSWIPFLAMAAIALLVTRSLRPLRRLFTNVCEDWTLLTFAMFGCMPLSIAAGFDEVDRLYSLRFMVALTLLMCVTALVYLRSARRGQRVLALLIGSLLIVAIVTVAPMVYWLENGWVNVPGTVMAGIVSVALMFSPALLELLRRAAQPSRAGC